MRLPCNSHSYSTLVTICIECSWQFTRVLCTHSQGSNVTTSPSVLWIRLSGILKATYKCTPSCAHICMHTYTHTHIHTNMHILCMCIVLPIGTNIHVWPTHTSTHILQLHNQATGLLDPQLPALHSLLHSLLQLCNTFLKHVSQAMGLQTHSNHIIIGINTAIDHFPEGHVR